MKITLWIGLLFYMFSLQGCFYVYPKNNGSDEFEEFVYNWHYDINFDEQGHPNISSSEQKKSSTLKPLNNCNAPKGCQILINGNVVDIRVQSLNKKSIVTIMTAPKDKSAQ